MVLEDVVCSTGPLIEIDIYSYLCSRWNLLEQMEIVTDESIGYRRGESASLLYESDPPRYLAGSLLSSQWVY